MFSVVNIFKDPYAFLSDGKKRKQLQQGCKKKKRKAENSVITLDIDIH